MESGDVQSSAPQGRLAMKAELVDKPREVAERMGF